MTEQRVMVVTEGAPKLTDFESEKARAFLRDYAVYENRLDTADRQVPMKRCLEPSDLETLLMCSEEMPGVEIVRGIPEGQTAAVHVDIESPIRAFNLERKDKDEDDEETVPDEAYQKILYLSNAHIEKMLIHVLGPSSELEASEILKAITMERGVAFSRLSLATVYVKMWRDGMAWCRQVLPRNKVLVKLFLANIFPRKLAQQLENLGIKNIDEVMNEFVSAYRKCAEAHKILSTMESAVAKPKADPAPQKDGGQKAKPWKAQTPPAANPAASGKAPDWKSQQVCYNCNKKGHIKPNCPDLKAAGKPDIKKLGVLMKYNGQTTGPYLAVDVWGGEEKPSRVLRMSAYCDSGSQAEVIGKNWVPYLEIHGGSVEETKPVKLQWLDKDVTVTVTQAMNLTVEIAGCNKKMNLTFLIAPWDLEYIILGWNALTQDNVVNDLTELIKMQKDLSIPVVTSKEDDNMVITDMDGSKVAVDELLWVDEPSQKEPAPDTILTVHEQDELNGLLHTYDDVFQELPAGSALVEPMVVTLKPGWKHPPMEPPRRYSPRVEAAIIMDIEKQLNSGVIELSDATYGLNVHVVPKVDSESGFRFTIDFRPLNSGVVTDPYPLPQIPVIIGSMAGSRYFARLDLRSGYWQFPVAPESRKLLAFQFRGRMYTYSVVPMGYVDATFHFQKNMVACFQEKFGRGIFIYLDDIIIYASIFDEFLALLDYAFNVCRLKKLSLKRGKCVFGLSEIEILGHVISPDGIKMSDRRKDAVNALPFPRNVHELRKFLGAVNYMRTFIPNYSVLAKPLSSQINVPLAEWPQDKMRRAFTEVKEAVNSQLVLSHLDYAKPVVVQTDASTLGVGGCLRQGCT